MKDLVLQSLLHGIIAAVLFKGSALLGLIYGGIAFGVIALCAINPRVKLNNDKTPR